MTKKGLPLHFNYPMMSLIRELVMKERHRVWMEEYAPRLKKDVNVEKAFSEAIEQCENPLLRQGLCNLILGECREVEDLIKAGLKGINIVCPECGEEKWVVDQEPNLNQDFIYLPRWRELSCGHVIGIQGKLKEEKP